MQLLVKRVERDAKAIEELEKAVAEFLVELEFRLSALRERYEPRKAA
jgi:hypothetical protein